MENRNKDGTIKKGVVLNPKGRPKGAANKNTLLLSVIIDYLLEDNLNKFKEELNNLKGKDYFYVITKLMDLGTDKRNHIKEVDLLLNKFNKNIEKKLNLKDPLIY